METNSKTEKLIIDGEKNFYELKENKNISAFENSIFNSILKINKKIYQNLNKFNQKRY
jgi:hypothetical protein